jgi:hypothetical protein
MPKTGYAYALDRLLNLNADFEFLQDIEKVVCRYPQITLEKS